MSNFLVTVVSFVVVLGVMVLVHEWGHFVVAKAFGVRVEIFSVGFGTRLWGVKRGDTDYRLSALPLGGYVKMAGDNPLEERKGDPDEFLSKPRWQRVCIALAGPIANIVLSILIIAGVYMSGDKQPAYLDQPMVVAGVLQDSAAQKAGLAAGDHIVKINNATNPTWDKARLELMSTLPGRSIPVIYDRNGQELSTSVSAVQSLVDVFGYPADRTIVGTVAPGMPAERAGLKAGDEILAANGQPLMSGAELPSIIQKAQSNPLDLEIQRGTERLHVTVQAQQINPGSSPAQWQVGVGLTGATVERRFRVAESVVESVATNSMMARQIVYIVAELFSGKVSLKQLMGPLGIAQQSGQAAREGPAELLFLMAEIGVNLGILNLLPIPPLDGGHILLLFIEGAMRHDLSIRFKERFVTVSMVFLLLVFAVVMYNDVLRLIPHR